MTEDFKILENAIYIALVAHKGQEDKGGNDYILHPLRVMRDVDSIDEKIVAILHDVVEDTNYTFGDLKNEGIPQNCIDALVLLTHDKNTSYEDYIKQIKTNELAKAVKLADLKDNSDISRLKTVMEKDKIRLKKYQKAIDVLNDSHTPPA